MGKKGLYFFYMPYIILVSYGNEVSMGKMQYIFKALIVAHIGNILIKLYSIVKGSQPSDDLWCIIYRTIICNNQLFNRIRLIQN